MTAHDLEPVPVRDGRRARVLLGAAIAAFAIWLAAEAWLHRYAPLVPGSFQAGPVADPPAERVLDSFAGPDAWRLDYRDGGVVRYGLTLRNDGPLAVTIVDLVRDDPTFYAVLRVDRVLATPDDPELSHLIDHAEPLRPFVLKPHHERTLVIEAHYDSCQASANGSAVGIAEQRVKYRAFGVTNVQSVALGTPIEVPMPRPNTPACPRSPSNA